MTGCPCHDPAVFGHVQAACPASSLSLRQLDGGLGHLGAFGGPLVLEPLDEPTPPAAAVAAPEPVVGTVEQLARRRHRVLTRLFTS